MLLATMASADDSAAPTKSEKHFAGMVSAVDSKERTLQAHAFLASKRFNLGDNCLITLPDKSSGSINDMRPGQKITVYYTDAQGVLVADRVEQHAMRQVGTIKSISTDTGTFVVHIGPGDKTYMLADNCRVVLRDNKSGRVTDLKPGQLVTVTFETPPGPPVARQIDQTSASYDGTLSAIDSSERTVKAQRLGGANVFHLADGCVIVANGKLDARLGDLRIGEKVTLNYDEVDGVKVVNRIAQESGSQGVTAK